MQYIKVAQLKTVERFRERLAELGLSMPVDDRVLAREEGSPLALPLRVGPHEVGNRWVIHPMEGWDAREDGSPSAFTLRRWRRFGLSGAKWIWGGEAAAVRDDGRANPRQTLATRGNVEGLKALREELLAGHRETGSSTDDLLVGLQLTHSGRFCRPNGPKLEPRIACHHPLLDRKFGIDPADDSVVWTDAQIETLIQDYVEAAVVAQAAGFPFVDIKACHGYLLHEFLGAYTRPGPFGGDFEGRTRVLRTIIERVRERLPELTVVVRLSVFDTLPYEMGETAGRPMPWDGSVYRYGFGVDLDDPQRMDLAEPIELMRRLRSLGVAAVNVSCGSPYYNPHVMRPAIFPPSDGYQPPEDPLVGVARQLHATRACKEALPDLPLVGTGYTYLQDYLVQVAQAVVRDGWVDAVGLGRMVLSYPELPRDTLDGRTTQRKLVCRTFSDCTTGPRNGMISGCYPLDPHYKALPEAKQVQALHRSGREADE